MIEHNYLMKKSKWGCLTFQISKNQISGDSLLLTDQRHELRGGGHVLGDQQHKDGERQQHRDAQSDFLSGVRRKPKSQQTEDRQPQTGEDDVEEIVQRAPPHHDREADVRVELVAASVFDLWEEESFEDWGFWCSRKVL